MTVPRLAAESDSRAGMESCSLAPSLGFPWAWHTFHWGYFLISSTPFLFFKYIYLYMCVCTCICKNEIDERNAKILVKVFAVLCSQSYCQISLFFVSAWEGRQDAAETGALCAAWAQGWHQLWDSVFRNAQTQLPLWESNQSWHWVHKWPAKCLLSPYMCNWLGQFDKILIWIFP